VSLRDDPRVGLARTLARMAPGTLSELLQQRHFTATVAAAAAAGNQT
jgi:hypothetical protein